MNSQSILSLISPENYLQKELMSANGIKNIYMYKLPMSKVEKIFFRLCREFNLEKMYSEELRHFDLSTLDLVIIHEPIFPDYVVKYIRQRNPKCRIILIMWNTLAYTGSLKFYNKQKHFQRLLQDRDRYNYSVLSFDKEDCHLYGMTYNNQFTFYCEAGDDENALDHALNHGVFFCGRDKNRIGKAMALGKWLEQSSIPFTCWMVPEFDKSYAADQIAFLKKDGNVPYDAMITEMKRHTILLDLVQKGQHGITWRPLEAMLYGKKLITDFEEIKNYDFYNPDNIYIIRDTNFLGLREWMAKPFVNVPDAIKKNYLFPGWLENLSKKLNW